MALSGKVIEPLGEWRLDGGSMSLEAGLEVQKLIPLPTFPLSVSCLWMPHAHMVKLSPSMMTCLQTLKQSNPFFSYNSVVTWFVPVMRNVTNALPLDT